MSAVHQVDRLAVELVGCVRVRLYEVPDVMPVILAAIRSHYRRDADERQSNASLTILVDTKENMVDTVDSSGDDRRRAIVK